MNHPVNLLVVGGSGLIGWHVVRHADGAGHRVTGTYRQAALPGLVPFDGRDERGFAELLQRHRPDAVVHAAGFTWVDGCEDQPERALEENALQPGRLARECRQRGIHFTYLSTSYVFDGREGPYTEDATPNPLNVYSRSKWEGERRVQAASGDGALIARVICVYGAEARGKNFAYQVRRAFTEGATLRLPSDQEGNPSDARDLARWLVALIEQRAAGLWHLGGPRPDCTRPEWARMLAEAFERHGLRRHPQFAVEAVPTDVLRQRAPRPLRAGMLTRRLDLLGLPPGEFGDSIGALLRLDREWFPRGGASRGP
ncbi:MAG: SDR family oxidoreductase [Verrucomicrobia bacterium]|nr:SDR family oxidoreductase [Verrucomicrobiota bacterium]